MFIEQPITSLISGYPLTAGWSASSIICQSIPFPPTSFVGISIPTKVVGILVVSALPTEGVGMQANNQIKE